MYGPARRTLLDHLSWSMNAAAGAVVCVMMMATVVDVTLRSLFDIPVFGTFDIVELTLVMMIFLALPETFRQEDHIIVDVVDHVAGPSAVNGLRLLGALVALVFLSLMLYNSVQPAYDTYRFGDQTLDLEIPRFLHWIPILVGTAIAIFIALVILIRNAYRARHSRADGE